MQLSDPFQSWQMLSYDWPVERRGLVKDQLFFHLSCFGHVLFKIGKS